MHIHSMKSVYIYTLPILDASVIECVCVGKGMLTPWRMSDSESDGTQHSASIMQSDSPTALTSWAGVLLFGPLLGLSYMPKKKDDKARRNTRMNRCVKQKCDVVEFYYITKRDNPTVHPCISPCYMGVCQGGIPSCLFAPLATTIFQTAGARTRWNANCLFKKCYGI